MARSGLPSAPDHDQRSDRSTNADASDQPSSGPPAVPTVSLPKGGGAIRGNLPSRRKSSSIGWDCRQWDLDIGSD